MVVTLRDQLKATKAQLAEAVANNDHPTTPIYAHIENSASEEERYRQQTASLINHLTEQAQLAEQREQQNTQLLRIVRAVATQLGLSARPAARPSDFSHR
jgi:uncharacterized membrane protein YccC